MCYMCVSLSQSKYLLTLICGTDDDDDDFMIFAPATLRKTTTYLNCSFRSCCYTDYSIFGLIIWGNFMVVLFNKMYGENWAYKAVGLIRGHINQCLLL